MAMFCSPILFLLSLRVFAQDGQQILRGNCAPCLAAKLRSSLTGSISGAKMLTLTQKRGDAVHCTRGRTFAFNSRDWMEIPTNIPKQGSKLCCAPLVDYVLIEFSWMNHLQAVSYSTNICNGSVHFYCTQLQRHIKPNRPST